MYPNVANPKWKISLDDNEYKIIKEDSIFLYFDIISNNHLLTYNNDRRIIFFLLNPQTRQIITQIRESQFSGKPQLY